MTMPRVARISMPSMPAKASAASATGRRAGDVVLPPSSFGVARSSSMASGSFANGSLPKL